MKYIANGVEEKWRKKWDESGIYKYDKNNHKEKFYNLVMFPYPSGDKLHIGHWYNYGLADTYARYIKMKGKNVFQPIGFDSFGLPAENYAIKAGVHPMDSIPTNINVMTEQLKKIGTMFDFENTLATSTPEYYKWTQWVFSELYKNDLAYRKKAFANWCTSCNTVLANEQVKDGHCDRCDSEVIQKDLEQWFFRISNYAEELLNHDGLDWPEKTKLMQRNWIGKSIGTEFSLDVVDSDEKISVYTTRIDTAFGITYVVLSPEHSLVNKITTDEHRKTVEEYQASTRLLTEIERLAEGKEKTGVFTGAYAVNPFTNEKVQIWIGDYVLSHYGTGAVMAVPAHDQRDFEFAKKYGLEIKEVISKIDGDHDLSESAMVDYGKLVNSSKYDGMTSEQAKEEMTKDLEKDSKGIKKVNYRLHDWLISRQRYWGSPIPIIYCDDCGEVLDENLPVELPRDVDFKPTGESPLASCEEFVNTTCPKCGKAAKRETDTMDTFVCSSWYFLRYPDPSLTDQPYDKELVEKMLPVDSYIGGAEHACMHLLYARFVTKVLADLGHINFREPFTKLTHQGMIRSGGEKMSKSKGNVVSPDQFVEKYGSDVFRLYLMFLGPFEDGGDWSDKGIVGVERFINKVYQYIYEWKDKCVDSDHYRNIIHKTIKRCTYSIENFQFNTAIAALMELINFFRAEKKAPSMDNLTTVLKLLAALAPHFAEEMWELLGKTTSVTEELFPEYIEEYTKDAEIEFVIQVNGKLRDKMKVSPDIEKDVALKQAKELNRIKEIIEGKNVIKEIFVKGKLINLVVK